MIQSMPTADFPWGCCKMGLSMKPWYDRPALFRSSFLAWTYHDFQALRRGQRLTLPQAEVEKHVNLRGGWSFSTEAATIWSLFYFTSLLRYLTFKLYIYIYLHYKSILILYIFTVYCVLLPLRHLYDWQVHESLTARPCQAVVAACRAAHFEHPALVELLEGGKLYKMAKLNAFLCKWPWTYFARFVPFWSDYDGW